MSKQLPEPQKQQAVYSFLQQSLDRQNQQGEALRLMLERMVEIETNVTETHAEMQVLAKEIRDENRLLPAEIDDLHEAVRVRSINIVRGFGIEDDQEFKDTVGKTRRLIWRKMKKKFGTSKYIHTKRKDFESALEFAKTFRVEDHI